MPASNDPVVKEVGVVDDAHPASGVIRAAYVVPPSKFQLARVELNSCT